MQQSVAVCSFSRVTINVVLHISHAAEQLPITSISIAHFKLLGNRTAIQKLEAEPCAYGMTCSAAGGLLNDAVKPSRFRSVPKPKAVPKATADPSLILQSALLEVSREIARLRKVQSSANNKFNQFSSIVFRTLHIIRPLGGLSGRLCGVCVETVLCRSSALLEVPV